MTAVREFLLPDLGEGLEDAELVAWRVAAGQPVELNQPLAEVNTAKALVEIPSPWAGVVETLHAAEGEVVRVGAPLVSIRTEAAEAAEAAEEGAAVSEEGGADTRPHRQAVLVGYGVADEEPAASAAPEGAPEARGRGPVRATPPVRSLARDLGVDLASVRGTGPDGRVTREDVLRAKEGTGPAAPAPGPAPEGGVRVVAVRGTRRMVAEAMARSVREIPHVTTWLTVDATWLQAFRDEVGRDAGEPVSPLPIVVKALAEICRAHPLLNASFDAAVSEIRIFEEVNVGIAAQTEQGLVVPVVHGAHRLGIRDLHREIARLAAAARAGRLTPPDLSRGTITISNVGSFGAEAGTPIINHPQGAVLALGAVSPRALVVDGRVEARPATTLSLSFDHRLMDGAEAGAALVALRDLLQSPFKLGALPR